MPVVSILNEIVKRLSAELTKNGVQFTVLPSWFDCASIFHSYIINAPGKTLDMQVSCSFGDDGFELSIDNRDVCAYIAPLNESSLSNAISVLDEHMPTIIETIQSSAQLPVPSYT